MIRRHGAGGVLLACLLGLLVAGAAAGCTSVRPTIKIGVLAPFEGLYRRSGYAALDAVRAAIADYPYAEAGILPLALDDGGQPQQALRSAQKLVADQRVQAVVGPLSPALAAAVEPLRDSQAIPWYPPHALAGEEWAEGLVTAAGELAAAQGAEALVLGGWTPGWPQWSAEQWTSVVGLPVRIVDDPAAVDSREAVFWMGSPADGADFLAQVRERLPAAVFVLGPQGEDPVFVEHVHDRIQDLDRVYWTTWIDKGYNAWAETHALNSPSSYLIYRAALAALQAATNHSQNAPPSSWVVQVFRYDAHGNWLPVDSLAAGQ
jgi:branched-chain amino acid transport system substrate-binding protein